MEINNTEFLDGLYGSCISKNRAVGYCHCHKAALTAKTLKRHGCLGKQCDALQKYEEHDFWRQHEQRKILKKMHRQTGSALHN
jgi:hypothetical protein